MTAQIGNIVGFVDKRESGASASRDNADQVGTVANYADESSLDTRLAAANGAYYTAARLREMTHNDKVYALRTTDDSASI